MSETVVRGWVEGQTLQLPEGMNPEDEIDAKEAIWWHLHPGDPGYEQTLHEYCGFTEDEWRKRRLARGWR